MSLSRDPYQVVLADLRAKRDEIDTAIRAIEAVRLQIAAPASLGTPPPPELFKEAEPVPPRPFAGRSIEDGARAILRRQGEPMGPNDLVAALKDGGLVMNSEVPANTVSSVLNRGWRNGSDVVRVSRGMWGLAEWYPDRDMRFVPSPKDEGDVKDDADAENGRPAPVSEVDPLFS